MKREDFFETFGDIDETFISEAGEPFAKAVKPVRPRWTKRVAAAACLLLAAGAVVTFSWVTVRGKGSDSGDIMLALFDQDKTHGDDWLTLSTVTYRGAYYEVICMSYTDELDQHGLPHTITADMVGEKVAEVSLDGVEPFTFYQYTPYDGVKQSAVYIAEHVEQENGEKTYTFALFCNYIHNDPNRYDTAQKVFAVIGVYAAEDIAQVEVGDTVLKSNRDIKRFYDALCNAEPMGEDGYQYNVFFKMTEQQQQEFSVELADTAQEIKITTKHGFRACGLTYEPKINYVDWACNHYRLNDEF